MQTTQIKRQLVTLPTLFLFLLLSCILFSCKKSEFHEADSETVTSASSTSATPPTNCNVTVCEDCAFQEMIENDTTSYATVLGTTYLNPYSISNMTQAYNNIHGTSLQSMGTTHYYVRFKPQSEDQYKTLDSALDLELYDYPLDRLVVQEGDYWPDAYVGLGQNEYPWLYTVVESTFQFPSGITYQNLASLNIPNDDAALEDEAFSLTGNLNCNSDDLPMAKKNPAQQDSSNNTSYQRLIKPNVPDCGEGYHWDYSSHECVCNCCPDGYYWDNSTQACVLDQPPPSPTYLNPNGMITFKTYDDYGVIPESAPLKYTRIVGRRFFKIDKTFTDANGNFQFSKRFPRRVTINVKFRTSSVVVKKWPIVLGVYGISPMRKNIGTYKGNDLRNLSYEFQKGSTSKKRKTRNWIASVALNTATETQNFLSSNSLIQLTDKIKIFLSEVWDQTETPQYDFIRRSGYDSRDQVSLSWITPDINSITTSKVTLNVAQQLGLFYLDRVQQASDNGTNIFQSYYVASLKWVDTHLDRSSSYYPFGDGVSKTTYYPEIVALFQGFAQQFGHTVANRIYGSGEYNFVLQGKTWSSSGGISSSNRYLEGFDPAIGAPADYFNWMAVGLINDLMDTNQDQVVNDNVSGFTYSEIQEAYFSEPTSMLAFKNALKNIRPAQSTAIDQLFASYGY